MAARLPDEIDPRDAPDWGSSAAVARGFTALRDQAFFTQDGAAGLLRRLTWLFPDDGCYARAALGGQFLEKSGRPRPRKLFAFGNLRVRTPHHPGGAVYWWYHVVPAVRAGAELYALDPAVEPSRPLPWREWLSRMSDDPASLAISLCDPSTYMPSDPCRGARAAEEAQAPADLRRFLPREWNRVRALGLDPERALRAAG